MTDADHPIWRFLQTVLYLLFAGWVMWLNASHFDETEVRALAWIAGFMFAGEGAKQVVKKLTH